MLLPREENRSVAMVMRNEDCLMKNDGPLITSCRSESGKKQKTQEFLEVAKLR